MSKENIIVKYGDRGKIRPLSAQQYNLLSDIEKNDLHKALIECGQNPDNYEKQRQALTPKKVTLKELRWRNG